MAGSAASKLKRSILRVFGRRYIISHPLVVTLAILVFSAFAFGLALLLIFHFVGTYPVPPEWISVIRVLVSCSTVASAWLFFVCIHMRSMFYRISTVRQNPAPERLENCLATRQARDARVSGSLHQFAFPRGIQRRGRSFPRSGVGAAVCQADSVPCTCA